ncbi:MAG: ankyrin repeat domain-containing protein [Thermoanaerobaculia bacterium]
MRSSAEALLDAIIAADLSSVRTLIECEPELVAYSVPADRLIESIPHWLYVGDTPLHLAAAALEENIVTFLLERSANPKTVNRRRASPLHYASDPRPRSGGVWNPERQTRVIDCLIGAGAEVDLADDGGATPLHRAVRARGVAAVHELLKHGANVSAALHVSGSTPLHLAVTGSGASGTADTKEEQIEIVSALLAAGASPSRSDAKGRTPLAAARSPEIRQALSRNASP